MKKRLPLRPPVRLLLAEAPNAVTDVLLDRIIKMLGASVPVEDVQKKLVDEGVAEHTIRLAVKGAELFLSDLEKVNEKVRKEMEELETLLRASQD